MGLLMGDIGGGRREVDGRKMGGKLPGRWEVYQPGRWEVDGR